MSATKSDATTALFTTSETPSYPFSLAEEALEAGEVPVGCAFVYDNEVIAAGRNEVNEIFLEQMQVVTQHNWKVGVKGMQRSYQSRFFSLPSSHLIRSGSFIHFHFLFYFSSVIYSSHNDRFGGCGSVLSVATEDSSRAPLICKYDDQSDQSLKLLKSFFNQENMNAPENKRIKKMSHIK
ncbi:unnamed protein product [Mesocestoides corti]|uniref:CMP/dCMP-type deaminase domain-containing protein n=1 Tax=Mesocestoides corti TaxID=53468 RepID=A0A0R3UI89_MESCO|nr:unnamed protein product [Mesocestoides corti]